MPDRLLYGDREATQLLGVSRSTLWAEMKAGRLEFVRIGRRRLVPAVAIEQYVERLRATGTSP